MDREDTKKAIAVMQAYVDGEEIEQSPIGDNWGPVRKPVWDWYQNDYRIKPKPREFWVSAENMKCYDGSELISAMPAPAKQWIRVREITDE